VYGKIQSPQVMGALNEQLKKLGGVGMQEIEKATGGATGVVEGAGKDATGVTDKVKGLFQKK